MITSTEEEKLNLDAFDESINKASGSEIDTLWAILKYKEIGIYRKVKCMADILEADFEALIGELPSDTSGRILDQRSRHAIHDVLIKYS
jgi:hypothetical protein